MAGILQSLLLIVKYMDNLFQFHRYKPRHPFLHQYVHHFWSLTSDRNTSFNYEMLPGNHVDIIFDFSEMDNKSDALNPSFLKKIFVSSVNEKYYRIHHNGKLDMIGILFHPGKAFSFLKIPLSEIGSVVDLETLMEQSFSVIQEKIFKASSGLERIDIIEKELVNNINPGLMSNSIIPEIYSSFSNTHLNIAEFCLESGISRRKLERNFDTYIGTSPKRFQQINRIQAALLEIISHDSPGLENTGYNWDYYDQSHFIREFKCFTGQTPGEFITERKALQDSNNYNLHSAVNVYDSPYWARSSV